MRVLDFDNLQEMYREEPERVVKPTLVVEVNEGSYAQVSLGPLPQGYGVTLGNPLRRILYRGIDGYAVVGIVFDNYRLTGDGFLLGTKSRPEDIVLRVRAARIATRVPADTAPKRGVMRLSASGPGRIVTLADLRCGDDFEVVNPDKAVAELSDIPGARLNASVSFMRGRGYLTAPDSSNTEIGRYLTDGMFSPVLRVDYVVERMRVGAQTNFEKLIVSVRTNGIVNALGAIFLCAERIGSTFGRIVRLVDARPGLDALALRSDMDSKTNSLGARRLQMPVESLRLGTRAVNILSRAGVVSIMDILTLTQDEMFMLRGFGKGTYREIAMALESGGYLDGLDAQLHWRGAASGDGESSSVLSEVE